VENRIIWPKSLSDVKIGDDVLVMMGVYTGLRSKIISKGCTDRVLLSIPVYKALPNPGNTAWVSLGNIKLLIMKDYDNNWLVQTCKEYAIAYHTRTNHYYGHLPYAYHLQMTYDYGKKYVYILENEITINPGLDPAEFMASLWTHDIADTRQEYTDVKRNCGESVADITFALTNEKGKNRRDRTGDKYFADMREVAYAMWAKCCDRLANIKHSTETRNVEKIKMYKEEQGYFESQIYTRIYDDMLSEMRCLLYLQPLKSI